MRDERNYGGKINMKYVKKNEEAVSPVIGVILMVVITVIIAAVLAVFAFGVGAPEKKAPSSALKIEYATSNPQAIKVVHGGGDSVLQSCVRVSVDPDDKGAAGEQGFGGTAAGAGTITFGGAEMGLPTFFDAGESFTLTPTGLASGVNARVRVIDVETGKPLLDAVIRAV